MYRFPAISHHSRKSPLRSISAKRGGGFRAAQILGLAPAAWFRFNTGITVATGVSQWDDQSGNARHLKQATGAAQPAKQADGSILFDGTAQFLKCDPFTLAQPESIYLLFQQVTWTANDFVADGNTSAVMAISQQTSTPNLRLDAGANITLNPNLALATYGVMAAVFNGASSLSQVNATTSVTGNVGALSGSGFTLGASGGGVANFANIRVKEVIVFPAAHAVDVRAKIMRYLAGIGGVSV